MPKISKDKVPPFPLTPLQAADVWVFEARKEIENFIIPGTPLRDFRLSASALLEGIGDTDCGLYDRDKLMAIELYKYDEEET